MADNPILQAPPDFFITFTGRTSTVSSRDRLHVGQLPYMLHRLMTGEMVAGDVFDPFGLSVTIEWNTDGGPEEPVRISPMSGISPHWPR